MRKVIVVLSIVAALGFGAFLETARRLSVAKEGLRSSEAAAKAWQESRVHEWSVKQDCQLALRRCTRCDLDAATVAKALRE